MVITGEACMPKSKQIIRLAYASQSTSGVHELKEHLTAILATAQHQNAQRNICGVLCYGNGYFFQCIEGYRADVERLYQSLLQDTRHRDITLLISYPIEKSVFYGWGMKYIRLDEDLQDFLSAHQLLPFHPAHLSADTVERLIQHLYQHADQSPALGLPRPASSTHHVFSDTMTSPKASHSGLILTVFALLIGVIALALMGFTSASAPVLLP